MTPETLSSEGRSRTLHRHVMWELGHGIVQGNYGENKILPGDADLMSAFGVSRTVVREALKSLAAKGMVRAKARVGTRVMPRPSWNMFDPDVLEWHLASGPNKEFLRALTEIRLSIEPDAARLAAQRRTDVEAKAILAAADAMEAEHDSTRAFADQDLRFHRAVAEASGNPFMRSISALVEVALIATFTISSPIKDARAFRNVIAVHRAIGTAIHDRRPEEAAEAMRQAIIQGFDRAKRASARKAKA